MRTTAARPVQVALVGADGAGKSTISHMLETSELPFPVKRIYMGVNLDGASDLLPTTRVLLAARKARQSLTRPLRSRRATLSGPGATGDGATKTEGPRRARVCSSTMKDSGRLVLWMTEEWLRHLLAASYTRRGYVVVFDRHFFADFHGREQLVRDEAGTSPMARAHSWMLEHVYPRPDLVICLDAPAEVLWERKREDSVEWLEARRQQYLRLAADVPAFALVDVARPLDEVFSDVVRTLTCAVD
jgi:thymidylate kinase